MLHYDHSGIDANYATMTFRQWPATIAWANACISLDVVGVLKYPVRG